MKDQDILGRLRDVYDALDAANAGRRELGHADRDRLTTALEHLTTVTQGTVHALTGCADGARRLADTTAVPALAELAHEVETATRPVIERARTARAVFGTAHTKALSALRARKPGPGKYGPNAGESALEMLAQAAGQAEDTHCPVVTPAGLEQATDELERISSLTAELAQALADAAHRLALLSPSRNGAENWHRGHEHVSHARMRARELDRALVPLGVLAGQLHELAARDHDA
ncbi:hypothetical protein KCV87_10000 [Actinosynnema pretiosum subsp. pretiosum]|uniref:Uncharacterized protein n=1 Tax=Actinosynnema pretiosum subsp. pretiosum TaxID=103721 RepID=A0AA45LB48_9PSEU|nr:hypothetical protein APASM_2036 [Actinosynnema pretiosum subsp. pretiosum]QUF06353.1 hypothetical protein KCV87_10000 [Actinosynnema pretiosum subsp. pretiosum]